MSSDIKLQITKENSVLLRGRVEKNLEQDQKMMRFQGLKHYYF